jgi:hypothetical protein
VPELDTYHAALQGAAAALPSGGRRHALSFLTTVADSAAHTATALRANT